jgi:hypothetical protein
MKQFLLKDSTQGWINVVCIIFGLMTMMLAFIDETCVPEWLAISGLVSVITFLVYNIWVSSALDNR